MSDIKKDLVTMLNRALALEHAAEIQYLAHAELISGLTAEPVMARLKEIASDEGKHAAKFRTLIGDFLEGEPGMSLAPTHRATDIKKILEVNIKDEKEAIDFYKLIYKKIQQNKDALPYAFETLEHEMRHVILDEQEHVAELSILLGK